MLYLELCGAWPAKGYFKSSQGKCLYKYSCHIYTGLYSNCAEGMELNQEGEIIFMVYCCRWQIVSSGLSFVIGTCAAASIPLQNLQLGDSSFTWTGVKVPLTKSVCCCLVPSKAARWCALASWRVYKNPCWLCSYNLAHLQHGWMWVQNWASQGHWAILDKTLW